MKRPATLLLAPLFLLASCSFTKTDTIEIKTDPPGAMIWRSTGNGWQKVGRAPIEVDQDYSASPTHGSNIASAVIGVLGGGLGLVVGSMGLGMDEFLSQNTSIGFLCAGGVLAATALAMQFLWTDYRTSRESYSATLDGFDDAPFELVAPSEGEMFVSLEKSWYQRYGFTSKAELENQQSIPRLIPALGDVDRNVRLQVLTIFENLPQVDLRVRQAISDTATNDVDQEIKHRAAAALRKMKFVDLASAKAENGERLVVAVFDVFDSSGRFDDKVIEQLTSFLSTALVESGRFRVVPRDQLRANLRDEKADSYRKCYEESCQIELGKAVAAQIILSTQLIKVGGQCMVTANMFDLRTETSGKGATVNAGCAEEDILGALRKVVGRISGL